MRETLKARQAEILKCLITSSTPLDIAFFQGKFHKGERTIRYDIGQLKEICSAHRIEIRYQTKKGYYIPASQKTECSQFLVQSEVQTKDGLIGKDEEERYQKIFLYLFVQKSHVTAERIAEVYFVSRSTLTRFLGKMESYFENQFFLDARKSMGYRLEGDELVLRRLAAQIIAALFRGSYMAEDWYMLLPDELKDKITLEDISEISKSIRRMNARFNVWISNMSYLNLLSYCIVRSIRLYSVKLVFPDEEMEAGENTYARELLRELSGEREGRTEQELKWLSRILVENGIFTEECMVEPQLIHRVLHKIGAHIEATQGEGQYNLEQLKQDLFDHLKNFFSLSLSGMQEEENPYILEEIQEYYYPWFQMAKECAAIIEAETGLVSGEMEVCYLAVYLYKNSVHAETEQKNVLVVCATGKGLSHLLTLRIKNVFPALNVVGQVSPYQLAKASDLKNVDFVISTIPLENTVVPVVKISRILSEEDIKRIKDFLKYGKLVDEIPFSQKNEASFIAKKDSFLPQELPAGGTGLVEAATTLSRLILTLLEYTSKFPEEYQLGRDAMLGMIIHMSMAVPRWFDSGQQAESGEEFTREYNRIRSGYPDVFALMEKFFLLVEENLQIRISISERVAFFLYIIEEDKG